MKENNNLTDSLRELETIVSWFEEQENVDVEEGLKKVKLGAKLVINCRKRLREVENEFEQIQKELKDLDEIA